MRHPNDTSPLNQPPSSAPSPALKRADGRRDSRHQRRSRDVNVRLDVRYDDNAIGGVPVHLRSYNGQLVAPVIEARPGDTLNILLDNQLPEIPKEPHDLNFTNLHFHGLHVSPSGNADNVLMAVGPGQRFHYEVKIPSDHAAGTYWYHPHKHGSIAVQVASGLAGALIIRGDIDEVEEIEEAEERILVLQQIPYVVGADGVGRVETYDHFGTGKWAQLGRRITLNGEVEPTFSMKPGEVQRWRFIHAGYREPIRPKFVRRDPQTGAEVLLPQYQIALDGITTGRIEQVTESELFPGYRVDVMVRAADAQGKALPAGEYWLVDDASQSASRNLARIVVKGKKCEMDLPKAKDLAPLAPFRPIPDSELTGTQEATFDIVVDPITRTATFTVNGKAFSHHAKPRQLQLGDVEEWKVLSKVGAHPFHIHVNPFHYTRPDGVIVWKDTLVVPPGREVRLRTRYERYIGVFMLHCHILDHGDLGMSEMLEVLPPSSSHRH